MPAHDVLLTVGSPLEVSPRVYLAPDGEELNFEIEDGVIRVRVPTVHYHTMVVVE